MKLSFRATLAIRMAILLLVTLSLAGIYTYYQARQAVNELSSRVIRQSSTLIDQRLVSLLRKAETQSKLLEALTKQMMAKQGVTKISAWHLDEIASDMLAVTRANPEFGSISLTLDRTGEYVTITQLADSSVSVQTSIRAANGNRTRRDYVPFGNQLRETYQVRNWDYDPRNESYFIQCKEGLRQIWTPAYVFSNFAEEGTPGVTCATPIVRDDGSFLGVLTIDFSLADLSRFLQGITVGQTGYAFLIEYDKEQRTRVIAHPNPDRLLVSDRGRKRLVSLQEFDDETVSEMVRRMPEIKADGAFDDREISFMLQGSQYLGSFRRLNFPNGPLWVTCIVVPSSDFVGTTREVVIFIITLAAIALAVGSVIAVLLANRVAKPLQELVTETERIQSLDFFPRPLPETTIHEVDDLSIAMERMKVGLRSFEKLVPAEYARWLMSSGQEARLGGERRNLTTYFADIIGFTSISNHLPPEELFEVLALYLDVLSGMVIDHDGTIDKYNGDDVMAFWGAPNPMEDHALRACQAALASRAKLLELHKEWMVQGKPLLSASFGISTGDVVVGNVGSRHRMNYTVIGDAVNLASRLQGMNKFYGTEILISERTRTEAKAHIRSRLIDMVYVFGRDEPTVAYELIALEANATPAQLKLAEVHNEAMRRYLARDWEGAIQLFNEVQGLVPGDGPSRVLLERIAEYQIKPPPEDWDGTYHMHSK